MFESTIYKNNEVYKININNLNDVDVFVSTNFTKFYYTYTATGKSQK